MCKHVCLHPDVIFRRYFINTSIVNFGGDNVLALSVDCTGPKDAWW